MRPRHWVHARSQCQHPEPDLKATEYVNESDFDDLYGSKYYSASDLHGETPHHRIGKVALAELKEKDGSTKRKYLVYCDGVEKTLVLNKTNAQKLAAAYGKDHKKWI